MVVTFAVDSEFTELTVDVDNEATALLVETTAADKEATALLF